MSFRLFSLVCIISLCTISCNKSSVSTSKDATIRWEGDYAVDGCGFFVVIDGVDHKPTNEEIIDDEFKSYDKPVTVEYKKFNGKVESACFDSPQPILTEGITLISISK